MTYILGRCPKPCRSALAILKASPHALRYRLMAIGILAWGFGDIAAHDLRGRVGEYQVREHSLQRLQLLHPEVIFKIGNNGGVEDIIVVIMPP